MSTDSSATSQMRVVEVPTPGGAGNMQLGERPRPQPRPDDVVVRVAAAGVNGPDLVQRRGHYPPPKGASDLLGLEIAGEVIAVGNEVGRWKVGDMVCALTNDGGYAEECAVLADHCLPLPPGLDLIAAASIPETYFTVWSNIFLPGHLSSGGNLLVHGGSGGIGSTAIQLGKAMGAKVFTTEGSAEQCAYCKDLGADVAIDYHEDDFVEVLRDAGGADCILDIIGGEYIERNVKAARHDATIIQLAFNAGSKVEINLMPVMLKRLTYTGSTLRSRPDAFKTRVARALEETVWPMFATSQLRTVVGLTFTLEDASKAHSTMEAATHRGKIVLVP